MEETDTAGLPTTETLTFPSWVVCPECHRVAANGHDVFVRYFQGYAPVCGCGQEFDWWSTLLTQVTEHFMLRGAFEAIGASTSVFEIEVKADTNVELDFRKFGVPDGARILWLNYTGHGEGPSPIEFHTNTPHVRPYELKRFIYGAGWGRLPAVGRVGVAVTWIKTEEDEAAVSHLVSAAVSYSDADYRSMVLAANIAAETSITRAVAAAVGRYANKDTTRAFLADAATYSHQLKVLLPMIADLFSAPQLPKHIRQRLDALRRLRNEIAHEGKEKRGPITQADAGNGLTAAIFGEHYGRLLHSVVCAREGAAPRSGPSAG
ncbi:MAG: hypothetical protein AMXMBFR56_10510 [Polyangiaceae bacterium]